VTMSPAEHDAFFAAERRRWQAVVKQVGLTLD
jgi:hypothetical protein